MHLVLSLLIGFTLTAFCLSSTSAVAIPVSNQTVSREPSQIAPKNEDNLKKIFPANVTTEKSINENRVFQLLRYFNSNLLQKEFKNALEGRSSWVVCPLCHGIALLIHTFSSYEIAHGFFVNTCQEVANQERKVCKGLADIFTGEILYILNHSELKYSEICGLIINQNCMDSQSDYPYGPKWMIPMPPMNSSVKAALKNASKIKDVSSVNMSTILHLSDIHLDMNYQANTNAFCSEPLCCRADSSKSSNSHRAGYWGSFDKCDSVQRMVESLASVISDRFSDQYRYLLFSGDYIAHNVWNTSKEQVITTTRTLNKLFRKHIPNDKIVIPVIGNHEGHPVDQFCPPSLGIEAFSTQWLYDELLEQWKDWIPVDYHETFRKYGYYSKVDGKARFVVLNMNYCARLNFWIALKHVDLGDMLIWLVKELQDATLNGQYVYIVGHIAPDYTECVTHWVNMFSDIIEQYSSIIKGQFYGHTHFDEVRLFYSSLNCSRALSVAYLAPSVTTYDNVNPAFRLYSTDPDTGVIVDHRTYYMNLTKANKMYKQFNPFVTPQVEWEFEYSAKNAYNLSSLSPETWNEFFISLNSAELLLKKYYQYYGRYDKDYANKISNDKILSEVIEPVFVRQRCPTQENNSL